MNDETLKWQQQGSIYLWYTSQTFGMRGQKNFHFSADRLGCESLTKLIEQIQQEVTKGLHVTHLDISPLPPVKKKTGLPIKSLQTVKICDLIFDSEQSPLLIIEKKTEKYVIGLSVKGLSIFFSGIKDILEGRGDWALVGDEPVNSLWFWPLTWHT